MCAGTSRVTEPYKIGTRTTDIKLEILNLNRKEVISIDEISNQEFSEVNTKLLSSSLTLDCIEESCFFCWSLLMVNMPIYPMSRMNVSGCVRV